MISEIPRLRMFAGPNGSGKSTIKNMLRQELLGVYVNPDEIEKELNEFGFLDLDGYRLNADEKEIINFFHESSLLEKTDYFDDVQFFEV